MTEERTLRETAADRASTAPASPLTAARPTGAVSPAASGKAAGAAESASAAAVSTTLSTDDLDKLERDMQLLPANEVNLPGGGTLADLQARQAEAQRRDGIASSAAAVAGLAGDTSSTRPAEHTVTITPDGQFVASPVSPPEKTDATVAPAK